MKIMQFLAVVCAVATPVLAQAKPNSGGFLGGMLPMMLVMFAIIYFLMIRPEYKKQKLRQKMIAEMKKGDRVLTAGGIYGVVGNVKDNTVMVKIADGVVVECTKTSVSGVITETDKKEESK